MKKVSRFDIGKLEKFDKTERTPEGYLIAAVRAARVGVLTYYDAYGKPFKEFVPPEELFKDESMRTLAMKPLTAKNHPSVMLDSTNYKQYQVGFTGEKVEKDDRFLATTAIVQDAEVIGMIDKGMQEVSCGYLAELDMTPGEYEGEKYDAVQRNRHYNHLAIVDRGRAGREARLRLDSDLNLIKEENTMKFKIGDKEYDIQQEVADHISGLMSANATLTTGKADAESKLAGVTTQLAAVKADAEKVPGLTAEVSKQTGRADAAEAKVKELSDPAKFNDQVKARIGLIDSAKPLLNEEVVAKLDGMTDIDIMKAAIMKSDAEAKLDGKPDAYVQGRFEALVGKPVSNGDGGLGSGIVGGRQDAAGVAGKKDGDGCEGQTGKVPLKDKWKQPIKPE